MYSSAPTLVALPNRMEGFDDWFYAVRVLPKGTFQPHEGMGVTSRKVRKIWEAKGNEASRPKELEVMLLRNGKIYETAILNAENSWSYIWYDLDASYEWLVVEVVPEGYVVEISSDGLLSTIRNINVSEPPPTEPEEEVPPTGMLWWPMPVLLAAGLVLIVLGLRLRKDEDHAA
jgi:hypothetical protein